MCSEQNKQIARCFYPRLFIIQPAEWPVTKWEPWTLSVGQYCTLSKQWERSSCWARIKGDRGSIAFQAQGVDCSSNRSGRGRMWVREVLLFMATNSCSLSASPAALHKGACSCSSPWDKGDVAYGKPVPGSRWAAGTRCNWWRHGESIIYRHLGVLLYEPRYVDIPNPQFYILGFFILDYPRYLITFSSCLSRHWNSCSCVTVSTLHINFSLRSWIYHSINFDILLKIETMKINHRF